MLELALPGEARGQNSLADTRAQTEALHNLTEYARLAMQLCLVCVMNHSKRAALSSVNLVTLVPFCLDIRVHGVAVHLNHRPSREEPANEVCYWPSTGMCLSLHRM